MKLRILIMMTLIAVSSALFAQVHSPKSNAWTVQGKDTVGLKKMITDQANTFTQTQTIKDAVLTGQSSAPSSNEGSLYYNSSTKSFMGYNGTSWIDLGSGSNTNYQGIAWNEATDAYTRTGTLAGQTLAASPGDLLLPVQSKMRGCVVSDAGTVQYYLSSTDWNYKANGAASVLTGADGQVMVEIPKFYYRYQKNGDWNIWEVSTDSLPGFDVHPAFIVSGVRKSYMYISAYEGSLYDNSASIYANGLYLPAFSCTFAATDSTITTAAYTNPFTSLAVGDKITISGTASNNTTFTVKTAGDQHIHVTALLTDETAASTVIQTQRDYTATTGDKLSSVSGKVPITYLTRAQSRVLATNRGAGWHQLGYDEVHAIEILGVIEYGSFYWQNIAAIGPGISAISDWSAYNNYNPFAPSGNGNAIGNASGDNAGATACSTEKTKYSRYRGISNFYGHIWKFVDGININNNHPYVTNNHASWADDTSSGYTDPGVTLASSGGWQKTLVNSSRLILPQSVGGSSSTYITDYYYQNTGWRVACFGGNAYYGADGGGFVWSLSDDSGSANRTVGPRVSFK